MLTRLCLPGKRPDALDGLAEHPAFVRVVEEFHLVADYGERSGIACAGGLLDSPTNLQTESYVGIAHNRTSYRLCTGKRYI